MNILRTTFRIMLLCVIVAAADCSNGVPLGPASPQDVGSTPTAPSSTAAASTPESPTIPATPAPAATAQKLAYTPDLQPIFSADCTSCHGSNRPSGNYSMTTYNGVIRAVRAGSASSALVIVTRPNGSMYRFFTGDRAAKSAMVNQWVVTDGAAASR
jgi:hypothetical protein